MREFPVKVPVIVITQTQHFHSYEIRLFRRLFCFRRQHELTGFDAADASAVFFKLPCLKLIGHDKMISFRVSAGACSACPGENDVEECMAGLKAGAMAPEVDLPAGTVVG